MNYNLNFSFSSLYKMYIHASERKVCAEQIGIFIKTKLMDGIECVGMSPIQQSIKHLWDIRKDLSLMWMFIHLSISRVLLYSWNTCSIHLFKFEQQNDYCFNHLYDSFLGAKSCRNHQRRACEIKGLSGGARGRHQQSGRNKQSGSA